MAKKHGISLIYLTQSYYDVPNIIRKQANQLILKKINGAYLTEARIASLFKLLISWRKL